MLTPLSLTGLLCALLDYALGMVPSAAVAVREGEGVGRIDNSGESAVAEDLGEVTACLTPTLTVKRVE